MPQGALAERLKVEREACHVVEALCNEEATGRWEEPKLHWVINEVAALEDLAHSSYYLLHSVFPIKNEYPDKLPFTGLRSGDTAGP